MLCDLLNYNLSFACAFYYIENDFIKNLREFIKIKNMSKRRKLDIENLFQNIETSLSSINQKIEFKSHLVNKNYDSDIETIQKAYDCQRHEEHLNFHRDFLLKELTNHRNNILSDVNEYFYENSAKNELELSLILALKYSCLNRRLVFKKGTKTVASLFPSTSFTKPLDLKLIFKYYDLISIKKIMNLTIRKHGYDQKFTDGLGYSKTFLSLSHSKTLLIRKDFLTDENEMVIIDNTDGNILKTIKTKLVHLEKYKILVNGSNIFAFVPSFNLTGFSYSLLQVYDFDLNLVKSYNTQTMHNPQIIINNKEICYYFIIYKNDLQINIFNTETSKYEYVNLQVNDKNKPYYIYDDFQHNDLVHFNDKLIYFLHSCNEIYSDFNGFYEFLYSLKRSTGKRELVKKFQSPRCKENIRFDKQSQIYDLDESGGLIHVHKSNGNLLYSIPIRRESKLKNFYFTHRDTICFDDQMKNDLVEYYEY